MGNYRHEEQAQGCIFVFGLPRSGTTWMGKLFDSHPDTLYCHEPDIGRCFSWTRYPTCEEASEYADELRGFVTGLPANKTARVAGKKPVFRKAYLSELHYRMTQLTVPLARYGGRVYKQFPVLLRSDGSRYPGTRVVWKSINSLCRMDMALRALDQSRGVHVIRHPCGQISSLLRGVDIRKLRGGGRLGEDYGIFKFAMQSSLGKPYGLTIEYFQSLTVEERMAWQWALSNEKTWLECRDNKAYLPVFYEDVCADPVGETRRIFEFAGLSMGPQTRSFVETSTTSNGNAYYGVFKNPIQAAWRWREELEADVSERIMAIVEKTLVGRFYLANVSTGVWP